jgi:hypothetical protein
MFEQVEARRTLSKPLALTMEMDPRALEIHAMRALNLVQWNFALT